MKKVMIEFSGIYQRQEKLRKEMDEIIDCRDLQGTDCYCDPETQQELLNKARTCMRGEVHLMDSGNYHYMSRIFLETCEEKISLFVADNHTDMQPPALLPVLSCGSWLLDTLEELSNVREVFLIGPPREALERIPEKYRNRIYTLSREELETERWREKIKEFHPAGPVYYSVDKDVLAFEECVTNWDQGSLRLYQLQEILDWFRRSGPIAGLDICGEPAADEASESEVLQSEQVTGKIIESLFREECFRQP